MADTIPRLLKEQSEIYGSSPAQYSKDGDGVFHPTDYRTLYKEVSDFAGGLSQLGICRGQNVGLIAENRKEWLICDLAVQTLGAADVPRGCDSLPDEIAYILSFSECPLVILENERQLDKIREKYSQIPLLKKAVIWDLVSEKAVLQKEFPGIEILSYRDVMNLGQEFTGKNPGWIGEEIEKGAKNDVCTIIFTSGTTGEPKGVMLSHENFLHQVRNVPKLLDLKTEDIWLCVLPVWHSFERIMQYVSLGAASALAYSKPIGQIMLGDMAKIRPTWMASVPRIWASIKAGVYRNVNAQGGVKKVLFNFFVKVCGTHARLNSMLKGYLPQFHRRSRIADILGSIVPWLLLWPLKALGNVLVFGKIKAKLGGRFVAGISGGGALPQDVDEFFAAAGILLLEGYGLTETAPVLGVRAQNHPVPGTVGPVFPGTEIEIRDESGKVLPPGHKGLVFARGPQIMLGYLKKPELTAAIIDKNGWLNTGDLGMLTWNNELKILGREKDTIVLLGGENVEPLPIEQKLQESVYISQAMVVGQDQKFLAAMVVLDPDAVQTYAKENNLSYLDVRDLMGSPEIQELVNSEIQELVSTKNGFKVFERIFRFRILPKDFEVGHELSAKQEIKRHVITDLYIKEIRELFA